MLTALWVIKITFARYKRHSFVSGSVSVLKWPSSLPLVMVHTVFQLGVFVRSLSSTGILSRRVSLSPFSLTFVLYCKKGKQRPWQQCTSLNGYEDRYYLVYPTRKKGTTENWREEKLTIAQAHIDYLRNLFKELTSSTMSTTWGVIYWST